MVLLVVCLIVFYHGCLQSAYNILKLNPIFKALIVIIIMPNKPSGYIISDNINTLHITIIATLNMFRSTIDYLLFEFIHCGYAYEINSIFAIQIYIVLRPKPKIAYPCKSIA